MNQTQLDELFAMAIAAEIEANHFYQQVAERSANPSVRQIFTELAIDELAHRDFLEGARRDPALISQLGAPAADYRIAEATPLPALSIDMRPADAIALAMKKEQQAVELYAGLAAQASDPALAQTFIGLSNMEKGHKARLEDVFVQIGYPEAF